MERQNYINGLRALADWLEAHPEVPVPLEGRSQYASFSWMADTKAEAATIVRAFGTSEKKAIDDWQFFHAMIGGLHVQVSAPRKAVCTRRQVGEKQIPEQVIAAHVEPVYEYDCGALLAD